jgi:LPS sulfotransferase NodH
MTSLPRLTSFVCATPRSGSGLLRRAVAAAGVAGKREEYFVSSYAPTVRPMPDHLSAAHIPDPPLSRQGDHRSARWVARFKETA